MNFQTIIDMPVVCNILDNAKNEIYRQTGIMVTCHIRPQIIMEKERQKEILQKLVCRHFTVTWEQVCSGTRIQEVVNARHAYMYLAVKMLHLSHVRASLDCGLRDHTCSMHAAKKISGFYEVHDPVTDTIDLIKTALHNDITANQIAATGN